MEIKGFTYGYSGKRGMYRTPEGIKAQDLLYGIGVNYVCLAFTINIKDAHSTDICFKYGESVSDLDIIKAVKHAHDNGIKVCLKPMINCDDGTWRARISFPTLGEGDEDIYWNEWFKNYTDFMTHYAEIAEETGCEMLCLGCEMCGTEGKTNHWKGLIKEVRKIYNGKLMYNTNHGHENEIEWFSDVDYMGTSAYFPVGANGITKECMINEWSKIRDELKVLHEKFNKPILFAEIGCRSAHTCSTMPWDFTHTDLPLDQEEQAMFYDSCLTVFGNEPWFAGMFWWDWSTYIYDDEKTASLDNDFNIHLKKAESVLKDWYSKL